MDAWLANGANGANGWISIVRVWLIHAIRTLGIFNVAHNTGGIYFCCYSTRLKLRATGVAINNSQFDWVCIIFPKYSIKLPQYLLTPEYNK